VSDSPFTRRLRRLKSMSGDELLTRSRQEAGKRIDRALGLARWKFSEKPLPSEAAPHFFFDDKQVPEILALLQQRVPDEYSQIVPRAERICAHRFDLLGYQGLDYGKEIDWSLDRVHGKRAPRGSFYKIRYLDFAECGDVKVTWELNRHQHFLTLAKAYRITGDEHYANELFAQWDHWHRANRYPYGVNWASSLEVAFRSLSWLWTYYLLGEAARQRTGFREQFLRSLSVHGRAIARYLSAYFSPNTHLLGEAVALFFIGVLCPELPSAERWKDLGWKITLQETQRQVRADGLHFEQSLYYHVYAIDFFLHTRILAAGNDIGVPSEFDATIERMLNALAVIGRTGNVPRIGDDDGGRLFDGRNNRREHMLDPLPTGAVLFHRGDFKTLAHGLREETLWLLGESGMREFDSLPPQALEKRSVAFPESGLYVMNDGPRQIVVDAGPLGAGSGGHGHADALSVCVSDEHGSMLIDSGTFEYVGDGPERNQYRGTSAHNTLTVDGESQSQPRGPFAWAQHPTTRAEKWINGERFDLFVGSHNAYERLSRPARHRRFVFSVKSQFWLVRDVIEGRGQRQLDAYWHFAPEYFVSWGTGECRFVGPGGTALNPIKPAGSAWSRVIEAGFWSPVYGQAQPAPVLHFSTVATLPTESVTLFRSKENANTRTGSLCAAGENSGVCGYVYVEHEEEHHMFFAARPWALGDWASDAEFVYWGYDRKQDYGLLIFCGGTQVSLAGQEIAACSKQSSCCEVIWEKGSSRILGPNRDAATVHDSRLRTLTEEPILSDRASQPTNT
jgi:Heparinase II/III-like protein/Heparinase II/III N-terminus